MLARLLSLLVDLCRFRSGPQDFPYLPPLAIGLLLVQLVLLTARVQWSGLDVDIAPIVLLRGGFVLAATWAVLRLRGLQARYWQTLLSLLAVELLFSILMFPLLSLVGTGGERPAGAMAPLLGWLTLLLVVWQLLVQGHIWRHALNLLMPIGVLIALALHLVEAVLVVSLFSQAETQ